MKHVITYLLFPFFLGGTFFGLMGKSTNRHGRDLIICFGYVIHMVCFFMIFLNIPEHSPIDNRIEDTYIDSK